MVSRNDRKAVCYSSLKLRPWATMRTVCDYTA
jgi:hypothetical protein